MLWVVNGDEMIEEITSRFDWVLQLPIESQYRFAIGLSFAGFVVAAIIRETVKHSGLRYLARAIGAGSFFAVAAFAHHASHEWQKLDAELMVRKSQKASEIDTSVLVTLVTPKGNRIEIGADENGLRGIGGRVCDSNGRLRRFSGIYTNSGRQPATGTMGRTGSPVDGYDVGSLVTGLLKRAGWNGDDASSQGRFQFSREVAGESF